MFARRLRQFSGRTGSATYGLIGGLGVLQPSTAHVKERPPRAGFIADRAPDR
jgi:hypothetical protein